MEQNQLIRTVMEQNTNLLVSKLASEDESLLFSNVIF